MAITPFHGNDRSFDRLFDGWELPIEWASGGELLQREDSYVYVVDLPGFDRSEIELHFDDGTLSVAAAHAGTDELASRRRSVNEHVRVPGSVEESAISASFKNGVLEVELPTTGEEVGRQRIPIDE